MQSNDAFPAWMAEWHIKLSALVNRANLIRAASGKLPHGVEDADLVLAELIESRK